MTTPAVLLTHPGTQYSHALAAQLHRHGLLYRFATGIAFGREYGWLPKALQTRVLPTVPDALLHRQWRTEYQSLRQMRKGGDAESILHQRNQRFQQQLPDDLLQTANCIIGFDTSSWILAQRAAQWQKTFVLDASIAHPRLKESIYAQLREQYPQWQQQLTPKSEALLQLEQAEMQQATHIVAATSFTKNSYIAQGIPADKISINPYGVHLSYFHSKWDGPVAEKQKLIFAFLGSINARKGIPWLLKIWPAIHAQYPQAELQLAGYGQWPAQLPLPKGVVLKGPIHPADRLAFLQQADVFVFPSFFEGFAQTIIEAMACGLPVITTTHTVGPEVIENYQHGFVLTPGDDAALTQAMLHFLEQPDRIRPMGEAARRQVLPYSWEAYGDRWAQIIHQLLQSS